MQRLPRRPQPSSRGTVNRLVLAVLTASAVTLGTFGGPTLGYADEWSHSSQASQPSQSPDFARYGPAPGTPDAEGHTVLSSPEMPSSPDDADVQASDDVSIRERFGLGVR